MSGQKPLADLIAETRQQVECVPTEAGNQQDAIPGYRLLREIHRGGQGVVYLAHHAATHRDVAIKIMREGPFAGTGERARFEREVQILASIKHPHIVAVHDSGTAGGSDYFVMDYIQGAAFDEWADQLRGGSVEPNSNGPISSDSRERIVAAFIKICDAVAVAHQRGVIHRDIKPTNIRVDESDEPFVLDFGLAKATTSEDTDAGRSALTMTGQFLGTLPWASPEQVSRTTAGADTRSDVYALGLVLYRALAGRMPYDAKKALTDIVRVITEEAPQRLSTVSPGTQADLETIVLKCLSKSPERRYPSAGELAEDLRRFVSREPIRARPESSWYWFRMFAARNKLTVVAGGAFVGLLLASSIALSIMYARATTSAQLANQRAEETSRVAEFQAAQLKAIDPALFGVQLRDQLLAEIRAAMARRDDTAPAPSANSSSDDEQSHVLAEFNEVLATANLTNVALRLLDEGLLAKTGTAIDEQFAEQPLLRAGLMASLAQTLDGLGLYDQAVPLLREALAIRQRELGERAQATIDVKSTLATVLAASGEVADSMRLAEEAVAEARATVGDESLTTAHAKLALAGTLNVANRPSESLPIFEDVLQRYREHLGEDDEKITIAMASLARALQMLERYDEAMQCLEEVLARQRAAGDQRQTLVTLNNMGAVLLKTGSMKEAVQRFQTTYDEFRPEFGDDHPLTLSMQTNLAKAMLDSGQVFPAIGLLESALEKHRVISGELDESTLNNRSLLASAYVKVGRTQQAVAMQEDVVANYRSAFGEQHPHTARAINALGLAYQNVNRDEEAVAAFKEAIALNRALLGDDHSETLVSIGNLGAFFHIRGRLAEAEPYLAEAVEGYLRTLGPLHPHTNTFSRRLALVLRKQGQLEESLILAQQAMEAAATVFGEEAPQTANAILLVGGTLKALEEYEEALPYYERAINAYAAALNPAHPYVLTARRQKGALLEEMGRTQDAVATYEKVLKKQRAILGETDVETMITAGLLGGVLLQLDRIDEAEPLLLGSAKTLESAVDEHEGFEKAVAGLVELYERRHDVDAHAGFDSTANEWRAKLGSSQP